MNYILGGKILFFPHEARFINLSEFIARGLRNCRLGSPVDDLGRRGRFTTETPLKRERRLEIQHEQGRPRGRNHGAESMIA